MIRAATESDVPEILRLWAAARQRPASVPDDPGALLVLLEQNRESLLVAEVGGEIVGSLIAAWDGWRANLYRLAVGPARRRQGIALRLIDAGEQQLRRQGARRFCAIVAEDDTAAIALWAAAGYRRDQSAARFVKNA